MMWNRSLLIFVLVVACMSGAVLGKKKGAQGKGKKLGLKKWKKDLQQTVMDINAAVNSMASDVKDIKGNGGGGSSCPGTPSLADFVRDDEGYYLAFRMTTFINKSAYDTYTSTGNNDDDNAIILDTVPCGCRGVNGSQFCDRHFRSQLLDLWGKLPIQKVKVAVYTEGVEKVRMIFDGRNTTSESFFRQEGLLESPYTDLAGSHTNFFSLSGHDRSATIKRRFFINKHYNGCHWAQGWLMVSDAPGPGFCPFEQKQGSKFPYILYSQDPTSVIYQSGNISAVNKADVLAISIKLSENDHQCN